jgi:hypothetical protein
LSIEDLDASMSNVSMANAPADAQYPISNVHWLLLLMSLVLAPACSSSTQDTTPASTTAALQSGTPVPFESLQALLPTVPGWTRGEMTGMVLSVPMRGTQASLTLSRGDARMSIEIIDTVFNQTLYAPVVAYLTEGFQTTTDDGTKRAAKVQDQPALEEFTQDSQTAALTVLVGKRFLVHVETTGVSDMTSARIAAAGIDMAKLAALK